MKNIRRRGLRLLSTGINDYQRVPVCRHTGVVYNEKLATESLSRTILQDMRR